MLKVGQKVKFTKACLKWYSDYSFEGHSRNNAIELEDNAEKYLIDKLLGLGFKYSAKILKISSSDTYLVEIKLTKKLKTTRYHDKQDFVK